MANAKVCDICGDTLFDYSRFEKYKIKVSKYNNPGFNTWGGWQHYDICNECQCNIRTFLRLAKDKVGDGHAKMRVLWAKTNDN